MCREQEHPLNACFCSRLQESLGTPLGWTEEPKRIGNLARLIFIYRGRIVRLRELEAGLPEPAKIRRARIVEEGLAWSEPASHPSRSDLRLGSKAESDHEHHGEAGEGATDPLGASLQMTTRCSHGRRVETDHEKGAVGDLAGEFDHAGPGRQQVDRSRCRAPAPQAARRPTELNVL